MHHVQMPDCKGPGLSYTYDYSFEIKNPQACNRSSLA